MHVGQLHCIWFDIEESEWEIFLDALAKFLYLSLNIYSEKLFSVFLQLVLIQTIYYFGKCLLLGYSNEILFFETAKIF